MSAANGKAGEKREKRGLDALYRISALRGSEGDPKEALEAILEEVTKTFGASSASVSLVNPGTGLLEVEVARGLSEEAKGFELSLGRGLTGWVAMHGEAALARDVRKDARYFRLDDSVRAEMVAPLRENGSVVGVLNVDSTKVDAFEEGDLRLLELMAKEASRVLENVWLVRQLRRRAGQLQALVDVGREMADKREMEEVLRAIAREARSLLECRGSALFLYDEPADLLRLQVAWGREGGLEVEEDLRPADSVLGTALRGRRQVQASDLRRTEEHHFRRLIREEGLRSMLVTPLVYENKALGVLVTYVDEPHRFTDDERLLAGGLADLGAIAFENARLYGLVFATEENMRKGERLTTLGMLAAEIAHEIRNPLMVLRLLFDSLEIAEAVNEETEEDLQVIREKLGHLEDIASRILDFGKNREAARQPLSVGKLMEDMGRLVRLKLEQAKVEFVVDEPEEDLVVSGDPGQLQQALLNLILNALAAMPEGGRVTLSGGLEGERATLYVRDTGSGIPVELRDKIFDSFLTGRKEGTGLGLAISKRILKSHEGDLELAETGEGGTTFRLNLPLAEGTG